MELLITIHNFDNPENIEKDINSPRSLEACLRSGYDTIELYPKGRSDFYEPHLTDEMLEIKYQRFERKRQEKIANVKTMRDEIITFGSAPRSHSPSPNKTKSIILEDKDKVSHMLELEQKRMEAVKRRQEKELQKIIQREQAMVNLQAKIKKAEDEEIKKKREHDKKVAEQKIQNDKKMAQLAFERVQREHEENLKRRELAKKEAEFERKKKLADERYRRQLIQEARQREIEREAKMEEHRQKTAQLIQQQFEIAEKNRLVMLEREQRVKAQLDAKQKAKQDEVLKKRLLATDRIKEALRKHHELHEKRKTDFLEHQKAAKLRAKELEEIEQEKLKKQVEEREKKNRLRQTRLVEAYKIRTDHREDIVKRRQEKDSVFSTIQAERDQETAMKRFLSELQKQDKQENVERVARLNEFNRLQTLRRAHEEDLRYEKIQFDKLELQRRHREEAKASLIRKHAISNAMDLMRVTNDYTLLDQLFSDKKNRKKKSRKPDDADGDDPRLNQTV